MSIKIADVSIGADHKPFIIAEMSGNHNQSLDKALEIVEAAAKAGAHALKLQTYTADTMTLNVNTDNFYISDEKSLWHGNSLYELYQKAYTPWEWHEAIFKRGQELGLIVFSTPFDDTAVDFLEGLDVPCYKIASFENTHLPLIERVAKTKKPMIISTGMASLAELEEAVATAKGAGCEQLILLKCTSSYPASPENSNILTIPHMRDLFDCEIGLSDHTLGCGVAVASVALGARVIEKHFTLSRAEGGVDSAFSLEPQEMKQLVVESERAWQGLGSVRYGTGKIEKKSLQFRRSLYISKPVKAGELLTEENVSIVRPAGGLAPKYYKDVLGKKSRYDCAVGTAVVWDMLC